MNSVVSYQWTCLHPPKVLLIRSLRREVLKYSDLSTNPSIARSSAILIFVCKTAGRHIPWAARLSPVPLMGGFQENARGVTQTHRRWHRRWHCTPAQCSLLSCWIICSRCYFIFCFLYFFFCQFNLILSHDYLLKKEQSVETRRIDNRANAWEEKGNLFLSHDYLLKKEQSVETRRIDNRANAWEEKAKLKQKKNRQKKGEDAHSTAGMNTGRSSLVYGAWFWQMATLARCQRYSKLTKKVRAKCLEV